MSCNTLQDALKNLHVAIAGSEISEIEFAIENVATLKDPDSIGPLLLLLDDNAIYDEVMYSLIHAAEDYDDATYIQEFLSVLPVLCDRAPSWSSVVLMRVLNNDLSREYLTLQLRNAPASVKSCASWLLEAINAESPEFLPNTISPLTAAKS